MFIFFKISLNHKYNCVNKYKNSHSNITNNNFFYRNNRRIEKYERQRYVWINRNGLKYDISLSVEMYLDYGPVVLISINANYANTSKLSRFHREILSCDTVIYVNYTDRLYNRWLLIRPRTK